LNGQSPLISLVIQADALSFWDAVLLASSSLHLSFGKVSQVANKETQGTAYPHDNIMYCMQTKGWMLLPTKAGCNAS